MKNILVGFIIFFGVVALLFLIYSPKSKASLQDTQIQNNNNQKSIHLRFGHNTPINSALHQAALRFADEVKSKTNAKVIIDVYPNQELGNDYQMIEMARKGELDIILTPTAKMSVAVPSMQYADLPFYFPSREDLYNMLDGEPGQMILDMMRPIGLIGVTFWENGFKHLTANFPILSPSDLKGKKIRVMKSRIIMEQFKSFGAKPLAIDFHKTKQALSDKIVDGEENPLIAIVSMDFHKVQSDITLSEHAFLGYVFSFSEKSFSKLPRSVRSTLVNAAKEVTPWERKETQKREAELLKIIEKEGLRIHSLSKERRQEFINLVKHIPEQFEPIIGADVMSKSKELLYKKYGAFLQNKEHILIGINADVSMGGEVAGLEIKRGVELAVEEINAQGGVLSKPLEVVLKDHKIIPSIGIQNINKFAKNPNLVAIIGGKHGAVIVEEIATIQKFKIPYLIPWSATSKVVENGYKENYVFRVSANDKIASRFIVNYAIKNYNKPAIIVENSVWGRENLYVMQKYLKEIGQDFKAQIIINRGVENFDRELKTILASGAKSLILIANSNEGSKILQALSKQKNPLPIISHWGFFGGGFYAKNQKIVSKLDLTFFQTFSFSNHPTQHSNNLLKAYKQRYKTKNIRIHHAVAQAYDITKLLAMAIEEAGSIEGEKVKDALEKLQSYEGVVKKYMTPFTNNKHDALNKDDFYMAKFTADGKIVPVDKK